MSRNVEKDGFTYEVWATSLRMIYPMVSDVIYIGLDLSDDDTLDTTLNQLTSLFKLGQEYVRAELSKILGR